MNVPTQTVRELAAQLRIDSIRATTAAGSGHPTSSLSAADLMAVLLNNYLRFDWQNPKALNNDRLVFSKGHACPLLYAMFRAAGAITEDQLLSLRRFGSVLQGHPNPHVLSLVDVATGSLGQGLPIGVGMALAAKKLDRLPTRVYVLLGDSEMAEGSIWEAFDKAQYYKLSNLVAILDMNRLGQRGPTDLGWDGPAYAARARAFGWHAIELDGHDPATIDRAYAEALEQTDRPTCLVARTEKGHGVAEVANKDGWHGKALPDDLAQRAIAALGGKYGKVYATLGPEAEPKAANPSAGQYTPPTHELGQKAATRKAYGDALVALGAARPEVVATDAEVSNSTYAEDFKKAFPDRFFEMFISEQQMLGTSVGMAVLGKVVFASTFAAFFTRAYDQIRMASVSNASVRLCGSHAGVSIGEDGPSQMGLEDLAMMRAVCDSTVLYPCDANQTARLVALMADRPGVSYLRTTREKTPVIYGPEETFSIGGCKVLRRSAEDRCVLVGAGITLHEALAAYERLKADGILVRVIDLYSVKPIDRATLRTAASEAGETIIVVEDHWTEGGLGDAVLAAFADVGERPPRVKKLAVTQMPGSGTPAELMAAAGIDADHIAAAVKKLI